MLECIGFPPDADFEQLARRVLDAGESAPFRGPGRQNLRLPLADGLELRLDRESGDAPWSLWPHYRSPRRLRVAVQRLERVPDSPYDALLIGTANPPAEAFEPLDGEQYTLAAHLIDRRRLPKQIPAGHVLAVSLAGFALDVSYVGPNAGVHDPSILERACGAALVPVGGEDAPGGCMEVSARVRRVRHVTNPMTGTPVEIIEVDAPGQPLQLFVSRWQLEEDELPAPRPGWRIEGAFFFTGSVSGGVPPRRRRTSAVFG